VAVFELAALNLNPGDGDPRAFRGMVTRCPPRPADATLVGSMMEERIETGILDAPPARRWTPGYWLRAVRKDLAELTDFRFVLANLIATQLKVRYQRSTLGFLWTLINPLLMLTVMATVFSQIMRWEITEFALYLFSGLVPWQLLAASIESGSRALVSNEALIRKVRINKLVFPLASVSVAAVNMCFAMAAFAIIFVVIGADVHIQLIILPVAVAILWLTAFGLTLVTMTLYTFFRDVDHFLSILIMAAFYATPIIYPAELLTDHPWLAKGNPMAHIIGLFQNAIYYGRWPSQTNWIVACGAAAGSVAIGYVVYKCNEARYIYRL